MNRWAGKAKAKAQPEYASPAKDAAAAGKTTKPPTPNRESERKEISAGRQETYVLRSAGQARPGCDHSGVVRAPSKAHLVAREGSRAWDGEWRGRGLAIWHTSEHTKQIKTGNENIKREQPVSTYNFSLQDIPSCRQRLPLVVQLDYLNRKFRNLCQTSSSDKPFVINLMLL